MLTIEEAKKMEGTKFEYIFLDGDSIRGVVAIFDPDIGLTCLSVEKRTKRGNCGIRANKDKNGMWCLIALDFLNGGSLSKALKDLEEIKNTGKFTLQIRFIRERLMGSPPSCVFSK